MMKSRSGLLLFIAIASGSVGCKEGGCGGPATPPASSATPASEAGAAASASAPAAPRARLNVRSSGAVGALFRSVNSVDLKPGQKETLEKIAADLRDADKTARESGDGGARSDIKQAHEELVAAVKAGKVEPAKMEPHYAAIEKAAKAHQEREAEALNKLWAAMEPAQRKEMVSSIRKVETRRADRTRMHDRPDAGRPNAGRARLERLTRGAELDPEQRKKVEAIQPKEDKAGSGHEEAKKQMDALLTAFEGDAFDAKKLESSNAKEARTQLEEQVKYLAQLVPVLKPEQRERVARNLTRGPEGGRGEHRGGGGGGGREHDDDDDDDR